jgi:hypothetical protein
VSTQQSDASANGAATSTDSNPDTQPRRRVIRRITETHHHHHHHHHYPATRRREVEVIYVPMTNVGLAEQATTVPVQRTVAAVATTLQIPWPLIAAILLPYFLLPILIGFGWWQINQLDSRLTAATEQIVTATAETAQQKARADAAETARNEAREREQAAWRVQAASERKLHEALGSR